MNLSQERETLPKDPDHWFKDLIQTFFEEFILAFFTEVYEQLDFQHTRFLLEALYRYTIVPIAII